MSNGAAQASQATGRHERARSEPRFKGCGWAKGKGVGKAGKTNASGSDPVDYVRCARCSYKWNFKSR
eukprot:1692294-Pyramimonas_sp.AAC.1